jgi:hypothetical protein
MASDLRMAQQKKIHESTLALLQRRIAAKHQPKPEPKPKIQLDPNLNEQLEALLRSDLTQHQQSKEQRLLC